ncbi:MAG: beta-ketoacyl synthase N-terminal-like domain-containing protein [Planctomycetota bacterium]
MTPPETARGAEDVAIVGMSCLFPKADTPSLFWQNIVGRVDCVTDPPPDWQAEWFLDASGADPDRAYTGRGGYLGDLCRFDPLKFGIMPNSVEGAEPDQYAALRCAYEALADAGIQPGKEAVENCSVILGRGTYVNRGYISLLQHTYGVDQVLRVLRQIEPHRSEAELEAIKRELKRNLPPLNSETIPGLAHCVMVGRIANRLNLHGSAYTIDAACASSLIAVDLAMQELRDGRCDLALAGGVQVSTAAIIDILFCQIDALSRSGKIAPFSDQAKGTLLGQGCGVIVLKRRSDAERNGDRIYAVLKAVGVSSDGRGAGLLAPRSEGQRLALRRAYDLAGVDAGSVGLIEAHGTGIPMGDSTEVETLRACFDGAPGSIALGSVKSMISHLIPAAGVASLIKVALSLYHRVLPPTLHAENVNPALELEKTPFFLAAETRPWIHGDAAIPRRAGVNAFGFGGINAHAVLEEHPDADAADAEALEREWPVELVVVSAADRAGLQRRLTDLAAWLDAAEGVRLLDVAASCAHESGAARLAICATSLGDLATKAQGAAAKLAEPGRDKLQQRSGVFWFAEPLVRAGAEPAGIAFVFPGEGAQYVGMMDDLCRHFPEVRREFDLTDAAFRSIGEPLPSRAVFPLPSERDDAESALYAMSTAVEAVTTADRAMLALLRRFGIHPDVIVGHSSGEFAALLAAGAIDLHSDDEIVQAIVEGARCTRRIVESDLVEKAVLTSVGGVDIAAVRDVVAGAAGELTLALDNCPKQAVLAGAAPASRDAVDTLRRQGALCETLLWDRAYHTDGFAKACDIQDEFYRTLRLCAPQVPLWSCATAERYPADPVAVRELAVRQWRSPVRFRETVTRMHAAGARVFIEVGPRGNLSAFVRDTLAGQPHVAVPLDLPRKTGVQQLCWALGMLAAHGVPVDLQALYARRRPQPLDLAAAPPKAGRPAPVLRLDLPGLDLSDAAARAWRDAAPTAAPAAAAAPASVAPTPRNGHSADHGSASPPPPASPSPPVLGASAALSAVAAAPVAPAVADARRQVFADHQGTMRAFLDVQQRLLGGPAAAAGGPAAPPVATPARLPVPALAVVARDPAGTALVAECTLDVAQHAVLLDHTFGRRVSQRDPTLTALPVVPLALQMELMAQAAAALRPGARVGALRNVRTLAWLALPAGRCHLRLEARALPDAVAVALSELDAAGAAVRVAEAEVELVAAGSATAGSATLGPAGPAAATDRPSRWLPQYLYTSGLFHGPSLQAVRSIDGVGPGGIVARVVDPGRLAGAHIPVALIDGAGQLIGYWGAEADLVMAFPTGLDRVEWVPSAPAGTELAATGRVTRPAADRWTSDVELGAASGIALRVLGRRDQVIDVPREFWEYRVHPARVVFGTDVSALFASVLEPAGAVLCAPASFRSAVLTEQGGFWGTVLAHLVLSRRERAAFAALGSMAVTDRAAWLMARVVVKDALRLQGARFAGISSRGMADEEATLDTASRSGRTADGRRVAMAQHGRDAVALAYDPRRLGAASLGLWSVSSPTDLDTGAESIVAAAAQAAGEPLSAMQAGARAALDAAAPLLGEARPALLAMDATARRVRLGRADGVAVDAQLGVWGGRAIALCTLPA